SPELALVNLAALCDKCVQTLLKHAEDCVAAGAGDAARFEKARADLAQARKLANGFGLDVRRIDTKATWLAQMQAGSSAASLPLPDPSLTASAGSSALPPPLPPPLESSALPPAPIEVGSPAPPPPPTKVETPALPPPPPVSAALP